MLLRTRYKNYGRSTSLLLIVTKVGRLHRKDDEGERGDISFRSGLRYFSTISCRAKVFSTRPRIALPQLRGFFLSILALQLITSPALKKKGIATEKLPVPTSQQGKKPWWQTINCSWTYSRWKRRFCSSLYFEMDENSFLSKLSGSALLPAINQNAQNSNGSIETID